MKCLTILAIVAGLMVLTIPAQAHPGHNKVKQGTQFTDHNCVGGGCSFQLQPDGDLKMTNQWSTSRARAWWDFNIPAGHVYWAAGSTNAVQNVANCNAAGVETWATVPNPGTIRLNIRINNIGSCTVRYIEAAFISP